MNRKIGAVSSIVNICAVTAFAVCMPFQFLFGDYLSSVLIALSFVPLIGALAERGKPESKTAGYIAMSFAGMYAVVIILVYFAQMTTVRLDSLSEQAASLLDYSKFGLFFNYDLLGYCFMALSTFFAGLTVRVDTKMDKALKWLLLIHGIFAVGCFILPMTGAFSADTAGAEWIGTAILEFWCVYFIPVGILSLIHFKRACPPCILPLTREA
ncbi:MAG: hypothetical protein LBH95_03130 [Oscillospiraceae bacterium]|jgi:hypothetical protein|nr:hypothetical protein [Oscillospiraceae bacterium]